MKITEIRTSYKITMENEMCGMEMYLDTGCKVRITFDNGETLAGRVLCVEYGDIPKKNDMINARILPHCGRTGKSSNSQGSVQG